LDLEMSGNMFYHILLCLVGLKNMQAFHVAGDCHDLLEGRSSWEGGDSWGMKAATMGSPDWSLLLEFDRPLQGLQVYNGDMETEDMKQFKITPENYLKHHKGAVDVDFLVNYMANHPPAKLQYINVNGKTHYCKEGLGEGAGIPRSGRIPTRGGAQFRSVGTLETVSATGVTTSDHNNIAEASSFVTCTDSVTEGTFVCTKHSELKFETNVPKANCPKDVLPEACTLLMGAASSRDRAGCTDTDTKAFLTKFCYNSCFCPTS